MNFTSPSLPASLLLWGASNVRFSPLTPLEKNMSLPTHIAATSHDPRSIAILAKTIYRELRTQGYAANEVMTLAGELLEQVTSEVKDRRDDAASHDVRAEAVAEASG